jgi:hypothetical protein
LAASFDDILAARDYNDIELIAQQHSGGAATTKQQWLLPAIILIGVVDYWTLATRFVSPLSSPRECC